MIKAIAPIRMPPPRENRVGPPAAYEIAIQSAAQRIAGRSALPRGVRRNWRRPLGEADSGGLMLSAGACMRCLGPFAGPSNRGLPAVSDSRASPGLRPTLRLNWNSSKLFLESELHSLALAGSPSLPLMPSNLPAFRAGPRLPSRAPNIRLGVQAGSVTRLLTVAWLLSSV